MSKKDRLIRISLLEGRARAFLVETTNTVNEAKKLHNLSRTATAALGRTLTATSVLASMLKGENESVTVSLKGGGPLGTVLAVGKGNGTLKGYVDFPEADPERNGAKLNVGAAVGKNGTLTVVKDLGLKAPYVGQVPIQTGEIAEDFTYYFATSEQTPSMVSLGVLVGDEVEVSGGLIIQLMPGATEADILSVEYSVGMFQNISNTLKEYGLNDSVQQLLLHLNPQILETRDISYVCDCSKERVSKALIAIGEKEIQQMIDEDGGAEVTCHFCNKVHNFNKQELTDLLYFAKKR